MVFNLQFLKGEKLKALFGKIIGVNNNKNKFIYEAYNEDGSSGLPIILTEGFTIIGLHKGSLNHQINNNKKNIGIYLDKIIQLILKSSCLENENVIKCLYNIKKEDVNKDIQVYDNKNNIEKYIKYFSIFRQVDKTI